jgi:hypothetical protein
MSVLRIYPAYLTRYSLEFESAVSQIPGFPLRVDQTSTSRICNPANRSSAPLKSPVLPASSSFCASETSDKAKYPNCPFRECAACSRMRGSRSNNACCIWVTSLGDSTRKMATTWSNKLSSPPISSRASDLAQRGGCGSEQCALSSWYELTTASIGCQTVW